MLSRIQLRQFLAVVDTGSFTRAANLLNIAQPSLSAGIAQLESELSTRLFVRERRRISLTDAGNKLLPIARTIEREFHQAERQVSVLPMPARPLRLGVLETISSIWLERAVERYEGSEPLELTEGSERELQAALNAGSLDLVLTLVTGSTSANSQEALFEDAYCLALPEAHPLASQADIHVEQVASEPMIARRACEALGDVSRFFTEHGVRPRFTLRSPNDDRALAMVRAGLGVTVAPRSLDRPGIAMVPIVGFDRLRTVGFRFGSHWDDDFGPAHASLQAFRDTQTAVSQQA